MNPESQHTPFNELISAKEQIGGYFDLRESKENPNLVVKELSFYDSDPKEDIEAIAKQIQAFINAYKNSKLAEHMPRSQAVIGKPANEFRDKTVYVISEKIVGDDFADQEKYIEMVYDFTPEFTEVGQAFIDVYLKTFDGHEGQTVEFDGVQNYIIGENQMRPEGKRLYYIDTFPVFQETPTEFTSRLITFSHNAKVDEDALIGSFKKQLESLKPAK